MKLFNKIALTAVGAFMAVGAGVSALNIKAKSAKAEAVGYKAVTLKDGTTATVDENLEITWTLAGGKISIVQKRGSASKASSGQTTYTAVSASYIEAPRVYTGQYMEFTGVDGYMITGVQLSYTGTYKGNGLSCGSAIAADPDAKFSNKTVTGAVKVVDNTEDFAKTLSTSTTGGMHKFETAAEGGVAKMYISNTNLSDGTNTQLRLTKIEINYIEGAVDAEPDTISVTGPDAVTFGADVQYTSLATLEGSSTDVNQEVTWSVSDETKASISSTGLLTPIANGYVTVRATGKKTTTLYGERNVTISGAKSTDNAYVLDKTAPIASSGYDTSAKIYGVDGIALEVTKAYTKSGTALQFQKSNGIIANVTAMPADIKTVTVQLNKDSLKVKDFVIKVGAARNSLSALTGGVESYDRFITFTVAAEGMRYFEIDASTTGTFIADTIAFGLGNANEATAVATAAAANDMVDEQCAALNVSVETWNSVAGVYATLDATVKAILNGTIKTGYAEVEQLLARYDYIVAKYGYSDFMSRGISSSRAINPIANSNAALLVAAGSICVIAAFATLILLKRKKFVK